MRAMLLTGTLSMVALIGSSAVANEAATSALSEKRRMAVCMSKSMFANRLLSYNDARRDCKEALTKRNSVDTGKRLLNASAGGSQLRKDP